MKEEMLRRFLASRYNLQERSIGVILGTNLTIVAGVKDLAEDDAALEFDFIQEFGKAYINFGLLRFL
jgi:hypothetical protein